MQGKATKTCHMLKNFNPRQQIPFLAVVSLAPPLLMVLRSMGIMARLGN